MPNPISGAMKRNLAQQKHHVQLKALDNVLILTPESFS